MNSLALKVQQPLGRDPHDGDLDVFQGQRADLVKILWHDGIGTRLYAKRLQRRRLPRPSPAAGSVVISGALLTLHAGRHRLAEPAADLAAETVG